MTDKISWQDWLLSRAVSGVFVYGCYAIAHYLFGAPDRLIMIFLLAMLWSDLSDYMVKPDASESRP